MEERKEVLRYYLQELAYVRRMGREFAREYPKVAARLELSDGVSSDPHVERLIESFAFLTARLERRLDLELPEISTALLGVLYPSLANPVPPLAIARFSLEPSGQGITSARLIPRHTRLFAQTGDGAVCRFRTAYPVELWPIDVTDVALLPRLAFKTLDVHPHVGAVLRVRIEAGGTSLAELDIRRLRLHLHGDPTLTGALYDLLGRSLAGVALVPDEADEAVFLPPEALAAVGFAEDEDVIPGSPTEHPGYRLLQEYLRFAPKFHFFDLTGLERCRAEQRIDVLLLLHEIPSRLAIERDTVMLGCTPVQNLFTRTTEPIRIDQRRTEYRVVADARREAVTEIHSLLSVSLTADADKRTMEVQPFFSFRHPSNGSAADAFWHARRASIGRADLAGTDLWLSFVDLAFEPTRPPGQVVYARALCTNRELAIQLPPGTMLQLEETAPPVLVRCLTRPTETVYPALGGASVWKLVSTLSLNYLSVNDRPESLDALREILRLYNISGSPFIDRQIEGIREMHVRPVATRIGADAWRGFCRGMLVSLVFDETQYVGGSAFLFASVLHRFFALHAQLNTFTQLSMRSLQREQEWKRWPPLSGSQPVE